YNLRAAFPHFTEVRAAWLQESAALQEQAQPRLDLAYGDAPLQTLDYYACGQTKRPLLVFIHGGYWQGGDKFDYSFLARPWLQAGINVASVNYSLAPAARVESMVLEVRQAMCWLADQAAQLDYDPERIAIMGHSAGGHLAAAIAAQAGQGGLPGIRHVFAVSGVFDLPPLLPSSINNALQLDLTRAESL